MKILGKYQEIFLNTEFRQWNSLPRSMMESPLPVSIKTGLVLGLGNVLWGTILHKSRWPNNSFPSAMLMLEIQSYVLQYEFLLTERNWNIFLSYRIIFTLSKKISCTLKTSRGKESRTRSKKLPHSICTCCQSGCKKQPQILFLWMTTWKGSGLTETMDRARKSFVDKGAL